MTPLADLPLDATAFLLLFARVGAVLMLLPVFGEDAVPGRVRLMIALGATAALWGLLSPYALPAARSDGAVLAGTILLELLTGLALGMLVKLLFLAVTMAGSIVSLQVGLTSAVISDPSSGGVATAVSKLLSVAAAVVCMAALLHHLWIAAIVRSYTVFPVGALLPAGDMAQLAVSTAGRSIAIALGLAAPMIVYGIVFNVALGLAARLAPAMQVFFVAQPLNLVLGLALFATLAGGMLLAFAHAFALWMADWG